MAVLLPTLTLGLHLVISTVPSKVQGLYFSFPLKVALKLSFPISTDLWFVIQLYYSWLLKYIIKTALLL